MCFTSIVLFWHVTVSGLCLFLMVQWIGLWFVIVQSSGPTHLVLTNDIYLTFSLFRHRLL